MAIVTKPVLLDETGKDIKDALDSASATILAAITDGYNKDMTLQEVVDARGNFTSLGQRLTNQKAKTDQLEEELQTTLEDVEDYVDDAADKILADITDEFNIDGTLQEVVDARGDFVSLGQRLDNDDERLDVLEQTTRDLEYWKTTNNALPKVEGEGTYITLNDTADSPLSLGFKASDTTQETTTGKNIFNKNNPTILGAANLSINKEIITISSTSTSTLPYVTWEFDVLENDVIRIDGIIKNSNGRIAYQCYNGTSWVGYTEKNYTDGTSVSSLSYTVLNGIQKVRVNLYSNNVIPNEPVSSSYENVIVTKNNSDMTYEPYTGGQPSPSSSYPQPIHIVTGNNTITISNSDNTKSQTYPLTLGNLEMCNINNYADEFFKNVPECEYYDSNLEVGKWYLNKNIMKKNVDLNDRYFNFNTNYTNLNAFEFTKYPDDLKYGNITFNLIVYTNKFKYSSRSGLPYDSSLLINKIYDSANSRYMLGLPKNIDTKESAIEYIGTLDMYYTLKDPTKTLLSDTLQEELDNISYAMAYQDQTNISQVNEDRPFIISASTVLDLKTLLTNMN